MRRLILLSGKKAVMSIAVLGAGALITGTADAWSSLPTFNAPGIPKPGFPDFTNNGNNAVSVVFAQINKKVKSVDGHTAAYGDYILGATATVDGAFNTSPTAYKTINNETYSMYAVFNSKGQFLSGGESFYGCQPPGVRCSPKHVVNLYTVSFDKFAVSTSTVGLGFDTVYSTASGWAKQFQKSNESLYLYASCLAPLDKALASGKHIPTWFNTKASELTTVPLPATAWFLGSALATLFGGGLLRRRPGSAIIDAVSA